MAGKADGTQTHSDGSGPLGSGNDAPRSVAFARLRMRLNLSLGRLLTLSAPLLGVAALYLSLSWFGVFRIVPDWLPAPRALVLISGTLPQASLVVAPAKNKVM